MTYINKTSIVHAIKSFEILHFDFIINNFIYCEKNARVTINLFEIWLIIIFISFKFFQMLNNFDKSFGKPFGKLFNKPFDISINTWYK